MLRLREAPELPGPAALGLEDYTPLFAKEPRLERVERLPDGRDGRERWRLPLPGTPGADGRLTGPPRGAGTGWLELWRWRGGAVFGPRPADRTWNLLCSLRAAGVATPMPLFVAADGLFERSSVLLLRELEGYSPWLAAWRAATPRDRRLLERALEAFVARLARAGVRADGFVLDDVRVAPKAVEDEALDGGADCAALAIAGLREERARGSLTKNRMPSLTLAEPAGLAAGTWSEAARRTLWSRLAPALEEARSLRLELRLARALSGTRDRSARRAFVRALH
ncbi:MAG: hypothetical protein WD226_06690 [Planctomycetota bacterium]